MKNKKQKMMENGLTCYEEYKRELRQCEYDKAWYWLKLSATYGLAEAQYWVGYNYSHSLLGRKRACLNATKHENKTRKWMEKAHQQGYARATLFIAHYLVKTREEEDTLAQSAIDSGDRFVYFKHMKHNHRPVTTNFISAFSDDMEAQFHFSLACYGDKHLSWLQKSAEQGFALAQYQLGGFLLYCDPPKRNLTVSWRWFKKGSAQGQINCNGPLNYACFDDFEKHEHVRDAIYICIAFFRRHTSIPKDIVRIFLEILWATRNNRIWSL